MTSDNSTAELEDAPATLNGILATTIATALRELADANPHRAQHELRGTLERYIAEHAAPELADTYARIARLPRVEES